ncbi:MAG: SLBB domain-containing protein [Sedimentisphaerales bacterium]|nr:SLBB domain-containing protein [Sedimentisphaerales bacterium]
MEQILRARIVAGPYRTRVGDVLQLEMPKVVNQEGSNDAGAGSKESYICRIGDDGTIVLPVIGSFAVAGKSLAEIESGILAAYCPKYVKGPLPVYVSVLEYTTRTVAIAGAVAQPGIYALRPDQMSLVSLLMKAGGIVQRGATVIRIAHSGASTSTPSLASPRCAPGSLTRTCVWRGSNVAGEPDAQSDPITCRLAFERGGPLRTTGWLTLADRENVRIRKWLDLGSESQRSAFLREAAAATGRPPAAGIQMRLVGLARVLRSVPPGQEDVTTQGCGWNAGDGGCLVASLDVSPGGRQTASEAIAVPAKFTKSIDEQASTTLALPVRGLNIPFADVPLEEGDSVVVEPSAEQFVSVLGLVRNAGNFPYPPDARYNLAQAIGSAGGLDMVADPRYVSIYRLKPDGGVATVTVQLVNSGMNKDGLTEALAMPLRPGDVVAVEQTLRTRTNIFFDRVFRVSLGLYFSPDSIWNN